MEADAPVLNKDKKLYRNCLWINAISLFAYFWGTVLGWITLNPLFIVAGYVFLIVIGAILIYLLKSEKEDGSALPADATRLPADVDT